MAGKTRRRDTRPPSPKMKVEMPKGHLGLKSSPFAPTDCKLTSQFMVVDHMNAHYRNVNKAKSAIDNGPPKAWLVSQKVRDQARRSALKSDMKRREAWVANTTQNRPSRAASRTSSDVARDEMVAMMESLDDYDEVDNFMPRKGGHRTHIVPGTDTTLEVHMSENGPEDPEMALIDKIVADHQNSPSRYHHTPAKKTETSGRRTPRGEGSARQRESPRPNSGRMSNTMGFGATATIRNPSTPRSADLLDSQAHKFTSEKPFQPRINKTNRQSKLSQFKYYNAPPKPRTPKNEPENGGGGAGGTQVIRRSTTPLTESVDLMNASLMSRDIQQARTPTGVPPLDISLDKDHMHWLKEQSKMAQLRSTYRTDGEQGGGGPTFDALNQSAVTGRINSGEEELKYLEFITEVTNDVLDRGIFTNRVLKQVFHSHIQRRKHDLKVSRMRELLEELRQDLGVPATDEDHDPGVGLTSTFSRPADEGFYNNNNNATKTLKFADHHTSINDSKLEDDMNDLSINDSKLSKKSDRLGLNGTIGGTFDPLMMTTKKFDMATLRQASRSANLPRSRSPSPGTGRPPIPRRSSSGRLKACSRENSLEEDDIATDSGPAPGSKQDDDLSAYRQPPPPVTSTNFSPSREIEPILEQSETARTDATANYEDDYEDETARRSPTPPPKPTPRRRQSASSGRASPKSPARSATGRSSARSSARSSPQSTARSGEDTARSLEETARSLEDTARSLDYTARSGDSTSRSVADTAQALEEAIKSDIDTVRSDITAKRNDDDDF